MNRDARLIEAKVEESDTLDLLLNVANEDKANRHIWNISPNSMVWQNAESFREYLIRDFGDYYLYIACFRNKKYGIFGLLNLDDCPGSANLILWIDRKVRKKTHLIKWWILFLAEAQQKEIYRIYANIKKSNKVSLLSSKRYGFSQCNPIPKHLVHTGQEPKVLGCVMRSTQYNEFETKYINRYMHNFLNTKKFA